MTNKEIELKIINLGKAVLALGSRKVTEKAEKALSETSRVENKEDEAVSDLDEGLAEAMLMIVEVMKGEE